MQLERVRVELRPRGAGEALDLGLAMLRAWSGRLLVVWCLTAVPVMLLAAALLGKTSGWTLFALWWLAPLLERPLVFVLSRAVFDAPPDARSVLREVPRLWSMHPLRGLLLHRLDPTRALVQPVALLEGVRGAVLRAREAQLRGGQLGACLMLMKAAAGFELVVLLSIVSSAYFLVPAAPVDSPEQLFANWLEPSGPHTWVLAAALALAFSLGALVRASAGFALYLNRRTELEGWDLEIALRLLAQRAAGRTAQRAASSTAPGLAALCAAVGLGLAALASPASAQQPTPAPAPSVAPEHDGERPDAAARARAILDGPEFKRIVKQRDWTRNDDSTGVARTPLDAFVGPVLEVLLWIAALAAFALVIWWIAVRVPAVVPAAPSTAPAELFGLDIRPESLPQDVPAAALAAFGAGDARGALSLLYRGAIARLVHGAGLEIEVGDTEQDCAARVRVRSPHEVSGYFGDLTRAWTAVAWSHQSLRAGEVEALCAGWRRAFERSAA